MDFHGLARRQLQALCKANRIPANMTNIAMADALSALDNVEGIEEVMRPQSPGKEDSGSPEVSRTATRTSIRARKPPVIILDSGSVVSQSRGGRTSRKLVDDDDDKVEDEKKDAAKTPAVAGSRTRAPAAVSRKKADVPSVHKVYSTRRSVRLVEKQLSELCLGESKKRTQPIKIDNELSSEITESDAKGEILAEVSNETSFADDGVNSREASAPVLANEVARNVAAVEVAPEEKKEVAMKLDVNREKGISADHGELHSVAMVEEASFKKSPDHYEVEESINEVMKMETQANRLDSVEPATDDNGVHVDETVEALAFVSKNDIVEDSTQDVKQMEKVKSCEDQQAKETENIDKENNVECFKVPKKQLKDMSIGELRKLLKGMNISNTGNKNKEGDILHQDTPRPTRNALETLPGNTHV